MNHLFIKTVQPLLIFKFLSDEIIFGLDVNKECGTTGSSI